MKKIVFHYNCLVYCFMAVMAVIGCSTSGTDDDGSDDTAADDGGIWEDLKYPDAPMANNVRIAVDSDNTIIVANNEWNAGMELKVRRFDDATSAWENIGSFSCFALGGDPYLAIDEEDAPVLRYTDSSGQETMQQWQTGATWATHALLASLGFSIDEFRFDVANNPIVVYVDLSNDSRAHVQHWNGSAWDDNGFASSGSASYPHLSLDYDGAPYVCFIDENDHDKPRVVKHQGGTTWSDLGFPGPSMTAAHGVNMTLELDSTKKPVAYVWAGWVYSAAVVARWNSGALWDDMGVSGMGISSGGRAMILDAGDHPVAAVKVGNEVHALKWESVSSWTDLGVIGSGDLADVSMARIAPDNMVIVFIDNQDSKIHVWKKK